MATSTINISIPETMKADVEEVIAAEGYGNTSEFFRDLVRNYLKQRQQEKFESMLLEVIEKEEFTKLTKTDFEGIKKRGLDRLKTRVKK
jgi:antitoxin ParD1/3/4